MAIPDSKDKKPTVKKSGVSSPPAAKKPSAARASAPNKTPAQSARRASSAAKPITNSAKSTRTSAAARRDTAMSEKSVSKPSAASTKQTDRNPRAIKSIVPRTGATRTNASPAPSSDEQSKTGTSAKALNKPNKKLYIMIIIVAVLFAVGIIVGIVIAVKSCNTNPLSATELVASRETVTVNEHSGKSRVGAYYEYLGTAERVLPDGIHDGGLTAADGSSAYPTYGRVKALTDSEKSLVTAENNSLCARPTQNASGVYDIMDGDGYLYDLDRDPVLDSNGERRRLYKHTASVGLYGGDVSDSEPAVVKRMTFAKRTYSSYYNVTGLYAPAGEVIKVQMTEDQMDATGGIVIHIGQALYNGQANNIWTARDFNRMPVILNTMNMTKETSTLEGGVYTCYVGSFLGGPIYVRDENVTFTVTVSGAVRYEHFILGVTTEEEFEANKKSSAPYFDIEVWESGVLHSGPKSGAATFDYAELCEAATLWEKIALVSTKMTDQGIVFLYDPFVAAGAAVAFPGRRSVNCPVGWMSSSLNYDAFVSTGSWGNVHEYHHNFQSGWGFGYTGEVTNNALSLVSYSLFTDISAKRGIGDYGASGLSGWNTYTSGTWALNRVNTAQITSTNGLAVYATLLHNLGQDMFIKSKAAGEKYLDKWAENTHLDFSYFAKLVEPYSTVSPSALASTDYKPFVPISCVYQTGRSYMYDAEKRYIETMRPFVVPVGADFTVDLRPYTTDDAGRYSYGSIVVGDGLSFKIKSVDIRELDGSLTPTGVDNVYTYRAGDGEYSGKIKVTVSINDDGGVLGGKAADDVDLVLEFKNSHEPNKFTLHRTVYSYADGAQPESAVDAFENGYAGNIGKTEYDNYNTSQNSNTDVWLWEPTNPARPDGAPASVDREPNSVIEVSGKIMFPENGKFRLVLRGRWNAALFVSLDGGETYKKAAHLVKPSTERDANFSLADENYYCDIETKNITDPDKWLYFKSVLVTANSSYMGLGYAQWQVPSYSTETIDGVMHYFDANGNEVSAAEAQNAAPQEPTDVKLVSYVTAYRTSYVADRAFKSDYFYKKEYTYSYTDGDLALLGENNNHKSPDDPMFNYRGEWSWRAAESTFGHVNIGGVDATVDFTFEGTRFAILTSDKFANNCEVLIDGIAVGSADIAPPDGNYGVRYLSPELEQGKHTVIIRSFGETNIGSVALFA